MTDRGSQFVTHAAYLAANVGRGLAPLLTQGVEIKNFGTLKSKSEAEALYVKAKRWLERKGGQRLLDFEDRYQRERDETERVVGNMDALLINGTQLLLGRIYDEDVNLDRIYNYKDKLYNRQQELVQRVSVEHTRHLLGGWLGIVVAQRKISVGKHKSLLV